MDSSCGRSRRPRTQTTCRRRGASPSSDSSDSDADADDDHESSGVCISPGWPNNFGGRRRFRQRLSGQNQQRPDARIQYRARDRSRSPVTPSPPGMGLVSPVVSLSRLPHLDAFLAAGGMPWAPATWLERDLLDTDTPVIGTPSSTDDLGDSDSYSTPTTIRIVQRSVPSGSPDDDDDDDEHPPDDDDEDLDDDAEDDMFTQIGIHGKDEGRRELGNRNTPELCALPAPNLADAEGTALLTIIEISADLDLSPVVEDIENARALDLFDTGVDEDDDEIELARMYGVDLEEDFSDPGEDIGDQDHDWSGESGPLTPSDDDEDRDLDDQQRPGVSNSCVETSPRHHNPAQLTAAAPSTSTSNQRNADVAPVSGDDGPLAGTLMELLECPVCYEPMQPPIWQCSRGHLVCRDCAPKLRRCPTCRCGAQRTRNCTLEKVSSALRYPCRNRHRGCSVQLPPSQLSQHEQRDCLLRDATCRVQSCTWRGEPSSATAHARAEHASLTRMVQLGRAVVMGVSVPATSGQRVTRVLRLVESERIFYVHLQLNSGPNPAQWCSYVQEFGSGSSDAALEYRLDLDEEGDAEKRPVRPDVHNEIVALIIEGNGKKVDTRQDDDRVTGAWRDRVYRAKVYSASEVPDECPGSSRTRCFSYSQMRKGFYISNSGIIKARIVVTLWLSPGSRPQKSPSEVRSSAIAETAL